MADVKEVEKGLEIEEKSSEDSLGIGYQNVIGGDGLEREIHYRSCSWQKTAALLFSEYLPLAIMSLPLSFSTLGIVPGVLVTIGTAITVQYTSLIIWKFCMLHPEVRDVCDIGRIIFGGSQIGYNITAVMFVLNNVFGQGLHCLVGAEVLNTLTNGSRCTVLYAAISAIICFFVTLPRTLDQLGALGAIAASCMGVGVLLSLIFFGVQSEPFGFDGSEPIVTAFPTPETDFITGTSAFLNIALTLIGQIFLPSFIAEMKEPKDFPKAQWTVMIVVVVIYSVYGAVVYKLAGNQYITAPSVGSLQPTFKKIAFCFAIPTVIYLGALYGSITVRFIFFRLFKGSRHKDTHTILGWAVWSGIIAATWTAGFVIAEVIPFFSDLLSLLAALFDGWFGFIYWAIAYFVILKKNKVRAWTGLRALESSFNVILILIGFFVLVAGMYVSVQSIIESYRESKVGGVFSCKSNAI